MGRTRTSLAASCGAGAARACGPRVATPRRPHPQPRLLPLLLPVLLALLLSAGCQPLGEVGRAPEFTPTGGTMSHHALYNVPLPETTDRRAPADGASLWSASQRSLLGDRRAGRQGDILTVVIEIDERAEMSSNSGRNRSGNQSMGVPHFFGLPQLLDRRLPEGAGAGTLIETQNSSSFAGGGSIQRNERLTLRVAATVVERLPNGVLRIEGSQQVRVNHELRDLLVSGFVRPEDISRRNEITYDKIAGARVSYGGRGMISTVQQPRYGEQITEIVAPF
ncbi:MAG: flagellar basal body L-ring protein FlgH [Rhodobacteraceae bacterium]|nr:flagellar basal body L-ring protein FlgH [Paracoccaceae bacterium]